MVRRNFIRFFLVLLCGLAAIVGARLAYSIATCTITGTVLNLDGSACALCTITFDPGVPQPIVNGGQAYTSQPVSTMTDSFGNLTAISLPQGLVARVSIAQNGANYGGFSVLIPAQSSVTFSQLLLGVSGTPLPTPVASPLPAGSQFISASGNFTVPAGVNGLFIECWGAGGGGGGYGATAANGGNGGSTTISISSVVVCSASGGVGGLLAATSTAGAGGTAGVGFVGTLILGGEHGYGPNRLASNTSGGGGKGGYSPRGGFNPASVVGQGGPGGGPNDGVNGGGGGGAGGYSNTVVTVTPGQIVNIVIGTGGVGGTGTTTAGIAGTGGAVLITWGS